MIKFNRFHAAAIRRGVTKYLNRRIIIEAGQRYVGEVLTFDSSKWAEDSDLFCPYELNFVDEELATGYTLDLYVFDPVEFGDGLITNLDAKWNGKSWEIYDPFAPTYVVIETPGSNRRKVCIK